jgi:hypothetical protein
MQAKRGRFVFMLVEVAELMIIVIIARAEAYVSFHISATQHFRMQPAWSTMFCSHPQRLGENRCIPAGSEARSRLVGAKRRSALRCEPAFEIYGERIAIQYILNPKIL